MSDETVESGRKDVVCRCSGTTREQILRLVARGVRDLEGISMASGACSGCGACDTDILALLAELASDLVQGADSGEG